MKKYAIKIVGVTPYMQDKMINSDLDPDKTGETNVKKRRTWTPKELADRCCYRDKNGDCVFPTEHLRQSLINAGTQLKAPVGNGRKSMVNVVAGQFMFEEMFVKIGEYDIVDERVAVNHNNGARVLKYRPMWSKWVVSCTLIVDNDEIPVAIIKSLFEYSGSMYGVGSYRPEHRGMFGRFILDSIEEITPKKPRK